MVQQAKTLTEPEGSIAGNRYQRGLLRAAAGEQPLAALVVLASFVRKRDAARGAVEQFHVQARFQRLDLLAQ